MELIGAAFIASVMVTFGLLWKKAGALKTALVVAGVMVLFGAALAFAFLEAFRVPAARNAAFAQWFIFGGLAVVGGPVIGAALAWYSRRRFAQFRAIGTGKPYGDGI